MAELTTKKRKALPTEKFALPAERKYPIPDKTHAANAKARATQMEARGLLTHGQKEIIDTKANAVLGKRKKS